VSNQHADSDDEGNESDVDPAEGGTAYYHSREIAREGPSGHFVYREIPGLHYNEETLELTFPRRVQFPAIAMQWFSIRVCTIGACDVCGSLEDDWKIWFEAVEAEASAWTTARDGMVKVHIAAFL
jgi:hypothetical protein